MSDFHLTGVGQEFFLSTVPRIATALEGILAEIKRANDLKEAEIKQKTSVDITREGY